jgi:sulfotransferase
MDGLHRVRPQVRPQARQTILPPDLFRRYAQLAFWRELKDSKAFRIVRQASAEKQNETMPAPGQTITPDGTR